MPRYKDLVGKVFGRLTVIAETDKRKRGAKLWLCECSCGKQLEVKTDYLQQLWTKSCGCLRSDMAKEGLPELYKSNYKKNQDPIVYRFRALMNAYRNNALTRGLNFSLNQDQVFEIANSPCHYCDYLPDKNTKIEPGTQQYISWFNGIDRKDSNKDYTLDNCVPCCATCNTGKNSMSYDEFIGYLTRIYVKMSKSNVTSNT